MAHLFKRGIDFIAATNTDTIWHRDETLRDGTMIQVKIEQGDNEGALLNMSAHVWKKDADNDVARIVPVRAVLEDGKYADIETHVATISPSGRVLGVVTSGYEKIPFRLILTEWILALVRAGGIPETLGTFNAGRNFFCSLLVADPWKVPGDHSETKPIFNVVSDHGGTQATKASQSARRVYCANTCAVYVDEHTSMGRSAEERTKYAWVSVIHRGDVVARMREAVQWITDGRERAESHKALMARLASKLISKSEIDKFVDTYISIPDDASAKKRTARERQRSEFLAVMNDDADLGNHALSGKGISAYGLFQAVTRYEDWVSQIKQTQDTPVGTRRAFRAFFGEREEEKAFALDRISEMANS